MSEWRTNRETGQRFPTNSPYVEPITPICASCGKPTVIGFGACPSCGSYEKVTPGMRGSLSDAEVRRTIRRSRSQRTPLFKCQECGHKFYTVKAAERASYGDSGCPGCGGSDIDAA